jgi:hypothetical protein
MLLLSSTIIGMLTDLNIYLEIFSTVILRVLFLRIDENKCDAEINIKIQIIGGTVVRGFPNAGIIKSVAKPSGTIKAVMIKNLICCLRWRLS